VVDGIVSTNRWEWDVGGAGTNIAELFTNGGSNSGGTHTTWFSAPWRAFAKYGGASSSLTLNGTTDLTANLGATTMTGPTLGGAWDQSAPFIGNIGEEVFQNAAASAGDQTNMAAYVLAYWNIP
jgi:hypothetical protein